MLLNFARLSPSGSAIYIFLSTKLFSHRPWPCSVYHYYNNIDRGQWMRVVEFRTAHAWNCQYNDNNCTPKIRTKIVTLKYCAYLMLISINFTQDARSASKELAVHDRMTKSVQQKYSRLLGSKLFT